MLTLLRSTSHATSLIPGRPEQGPHAHLKNLTAYRNFIKARSTSPAEVISALDEDLKILWLLNERTTPKRSLEYLVEWEDTLLLKKHALILASKGRHGNYSRVDPKLYGAKATALCWQVDWDNTWEPEEAMHNQPESMTLFRQYLSRAADLRCTAQQADMSLTALQQQGHGHRQRYHQGLSWVKEPALAQNICINTSSNVNPET